MGTEQRTGYHELTEGWPYVLAGLITIMAAQVLVPPILLLEGSVIALIFGDSSLVAGMPEWAGFSTIAAGIALVLLAAFLVLHKAIDYDMGQLQTALPIAAVLILCMMPILPAGGYVASGGVHGFVFISQLELWYGYPLIALALGLSLFLSSKLPQSTVLRAVQAVLLLVLGVLSSYVFVVSMQSWPDIETSGENYPTPFSLLGMSVAAVLFTGAALTLLPHNCSSSNGYSVDNDD
jgi:hypothetical protein